MAIIHQASLTPSKQELLQRETGGPVEILGSYRFDDPAGEVGIEGFVVQRGDIVRQVVFTYRDAPLPDPETRLVSTMEHSVLGSRWVYDATTDPVAVRCFHRALLGEQEQAILELRIDGRPAGIREPSVRLTLEPGAAERTALATVRFSGTLGEEHGRTGPILVATWAGGRATVAELVPTVW